MKKRHHSPSCTSVFDTPPIATRVVMSGSRKPVVGRVPKTISAAKSSASSARSPMVTTGTPRISDAGVRTDAAASSAKERRGAASSFST